MINLKSAAVDNPYLSPSVKVIEMADTRLICTSGYYSVNGQNPVWNDEE